ncbi:hypothetical protein Tco_0032682 [Tanacetum coccineum]
MNEQSHYKQDRTKTRPSINVKSHIFNVKEDNDKSKQTPTRISSVADPHDHIREFLAICDMFKYGETKSEAVKLLMFPFSLCDDAKTWFNELNKESIISWEQMRRAIINKFFAPSLFNHLLLEIRNEPTQGILDGTAGGIFLYKSPNQAFQFLDEKAMDSQIDMRDKYYDLRDGNISKTPMNDDTLMCERHEVNYIQSEGYENRNSHNSYSHQSHHDHNDYEKSLTELNNDVRNDLEDFKKFMRSMRTVHYKLYERDDGKTTGDLPNKNSKTVNQEPQSKTNFEKLITKFLDGQRVTNMFVKNNINDMILKMKQNEKNFQTKVKNMERKLDEWEKSQDVSSEQTDRTDPPPPPQAHTEQVNVIFTGSGKSDDYLKIQKDPPPPIIVNNTIKKDKPTKIKGYHMHMVVNFSKLDKFEGVAFRRWQNGMHFLLSTMSVMHVLNTPIPDDEDDATM